MKEFNRINNITGWVVFAISTLVYVLTVEETASFWDCGEFIAVSNDLMVPHPPGAPFYLLMGRLFAMFAPSPESIGYFVNMLSVFSSSFSILFLFWTIVLFGRKMVTQTEQGGYSAGTTITLMGAGLVGALAYTFSDSFWFSAAEAEVYAFSSFFTAFVIWAMLKWDLMEDGPRANRWILLIAYMMGLSIGVHLLNLTTIPALALLYYFKKKPAPSKNLFLVLSVILALGLAYVAGSPIVVFPVLVVAGFFYFRFFMQKGQENTMSETFKIIFTLVIGVAIVGAVMVGIIPGLPSIAGKFEVFFVNNLGLPYNSGMIFFIIILVAALVYGVYYSYVNRLEELNTALLSLTFILIGYSCYALVLIRSQDNPPIDENDPENLISFVSYLKREQYGDRPLLYGHTFMAQLDRKAMQEQEGSPQYRKALNEDGYEIYDYRQPRIYQKKDKMLLPRIYSQQPGHVGLYRQWMNLRENQRPTFADNIGYMFRYQFGHMYFRYFMWNFAGRDGDEKEAGWLLPWEGNGEDIPHDVRTNKSRSNFYLIPLIVGLIGFFFQLMNDQKNFWVNMFLFFLMGLGLVLYLNSPPVEPRERDYIYVGSFYAFSIWIGLGVMGVRQWLSALNDKGAAISATALCLVAPILMGVNGWDNHDRSNRFHSVDQARNTLESCAPNAILFTGGDNDTFPLWYVQEVEGVRTDVRVVVMSYFSTDWYIKQMRRKVGKSAALPFTIPQNMYRQGKNDYVPRIADESTPTRLKQFIQDVATDNPRIMTGLVGGSKTASLKSSLFTLQIDSAKVAGMDFISANEKSKIKPQMFFTLKSDGRDAQGQPKYKSHFYKNDLAILDLLATNNWERPIYFNNTSANTSSLELRNYLRVEGMAFRLMPYVTKTSRADSDVGEVDIEIMAANLKKFKFRGFESAKVFHDEEYRKFGANTRNAFYRLALKQFNSGKKEEALMTLDSALIKIPDYSIPYSYFMPRYVDLYIKLGEIEKAKEIADTIGERSIENLLYIREHKDAASKSRNSYQYLQQKSFMIVNQLGNNFRNQEQAMDREIVRLNAARALGNEENIEAKIKEAEAKKEYFANEAKKYSEAFSQFYNRG